MKGAFAPQTKSSDDRRRVPPSIIARESSGREGSGVIALRQRLGSQGLQRLISERAVLGNSNSMAPPRFSSIQAKLTISEPGFGRPPLADCGTAVAGERT